MFHSYTLHFCSSTPIINGLQFLNVICNTSTSLSAGCPTSGGVTISPSTGTFEAGDELTCASDGYDATFTWSGTTGVNNDQVSSSANPFTLPEGPFNLTCTAEVNELTCTERTQTTLVESAYSMY